MMKPYAAWLAFLLSAPAPAAACELAQNKIVFSNMGTHIAWYCKASDDEKKQALMAALQHSCVPQKLKEWGKPVLSAEATDVIPYGYARSDAEKAGPILEVRLILEEKQESDQEKLMGYRVLAMGRKLMAPPTAQGNSAPLSVQFDIGAPAIFTRDCPVTGCQERFADLCPASTQD